MYSRASGLLTAIFKAPQGPRRVMANKKGHGRKRRRFSLRRVRIASSPAIGALATEDVVVVPITASVADKLRLISFNAIYTWVDIAAAVDGGLEFGLCHSDYSAAEVEECLEAANSIDLGDKIAQEQANRLVRRVGSMSSVSAATGQEAQFNEGRQVKTKLNWLLSAGDTLNIWMRNGSGIVYTAGSSISVLGDLWVKD